MVLVVVANDRFVFSLAMADCSCAICCSICWLDSADDDAAPVAAAAVDDEDEDDDDDIKSSKKKTSRSLLFNVK